MATPDTTETRCVLIAAFSGRALAQSARRAGFIPLVVDCFGDIDTREAAHELVCLPARVQVGFIKRPLLAALETLVTDAPAPPIGSCSAGASNAIQSSSQHSANDFPLSATARRPSAASKTRPSFSARWPASASAIPIRNSRHRTNPDGWLMKRIGGSGGLHIHDCPDTFEPDPRRYFQIEQKGEAISVLAVACQRGTAVALSRQWSSPRKRRPYRYGGAVSGIAVDDDLETRLVDTALTVISEFGLIGLVSLDFVLHDGEPLLLEVNPRPGATLDIFDDAR